MVSSWLSRRLRSLRRASTLACRSSLVRPPSLEDSRADRDTGNQYDEGTLFALGTLNISTTADIDSYLSQNVFPNTTNLQRSTILSLYPDDPTQGSPFDSTSPLPAQGRD